MIEVLNTSETSKKLLELIRNAKKYIIIASPYLKMRESYKKAIERKNIDVTIIYGKTDLTRSEEDFMFDCESITLLYCNDLHAKIYMNESECIISSMNLYDFSEDNNFELSTYFDKNEIEIFRKASKEVEKIKLSSIKEKNSLKQKSKGTKIGYCIRTGIEIEFNPERPFCYEAWLEWNKWKNPFYPENFCHYSGKKTNGKTSFSKPISF